jgi:hypothetical protein
MTDDPRPLSRGVQAEDITCKHVMLVSGMIASAQDVVGLPVCALVLAFPLSHHATDFGLGLLLRGAVEVWPLSLVSLLGPPLLVAQLARQRGILISWATVAAVISANMVGIVASAAIGATWGGMAAFVVGLALTWTAVLFIARALCSSAGDA